MKNFNIIEGISEATMRMEALIERAEQEYKENVTKAVHDFLKQNAGYYPKGLRLAGDGRNFSHHYLEIWNEDGKRVQRTFIAASNGYQYKPCLTLKLQEESVAALRHIASCIERIAEHIDRFEQVDGGEMFEYGGMHFKGTHTLRELGVADAPDYVLPEIVRFGWAPEHMQYYTGDDEKAVHKNWSQADFLKAAKDSDKYDVYMCMESGRYYYPAADKIADVCMESLKKNIAFWIKEHEERDAA